MSLGWLVIVRRLSEEQRAEAAEDAVGFAAKMQAGEYAASEHEEIMRWETGDIGGIDFLDELVKRGAGYSVLQHGGYPFSYLVPAGMSRTFRAELPNNEWVYVEAWDVS